MNEHIDHNHEHTAHSHKRNFSYNNAFIIAIIANGLFVILQIFFSYKANSTSLLADAFHNLGDVMGLIIAWIGMRFMQSKPTDKSTYGLKKSSILAALANGILLVFTCGIIAAEAIYQFFYPANIQAVPVMVVAGIGIVVNGLTAALFLRGQEDLNIRGAYLHLFYDALISLGVVVSAVLLYWTNWLWLDPLVGLIIALIILKGTWALFRDSLHLMIDGVPQNISRAEVSDFFLKKRGVLGLHDLHIWAMSTQENALSVHLFMPSEKLSDRLRADWIKQLEERFNIQHVTIQIERTKIHCKDSCATPCVRLVVTPNYL